jgi:hypothetical protein
MDSFAGPFATERPAELQEIWWRMRTPEEGIMDHNTNILWAQ